MPAIKLKKAAAEHQAEKDREEREKETAEMPSVKARDINPGASLLKGLDANILLEKRKRPIHPSEQKLTDWLESNLEKNEKCHVSIVGLYDYFGEACSFDGTAVVSQDIFNKRVHEKFGKTFALKESSPYKGVIKERSTEDKPKVKSESLRLKMKEIIEEAIKEAGNPEKGVRFGNLKQYIACNYPALHLDLRPAYLKAALERGVRYGYLQLTKGVGLTGYFRLPVDELPDEDEGEGEAPAADKPEEAKEGETEQQNGDTEAVVEKEAPKRKKKSEKKKEGEGEGEEGAEVKEGEEGADGEEKKKKKKKKHKKRRPRSDASFHAAPQKIEDTFALAMTYMCEPKQTSFGKIRKYITEHYPLVDTENELKSKMEKGERKGFWEHVTGKGMGGTFRLLIDEFDPNSTDNVEDMICSAIIACNEPKQASVMQLKKYILEYHPEFNIEARPKLFKMALERALKKQMIIQISGLGATGSFQMWSPFLPSPALLAGDDNDDDIIEEMFSVKEEAYVPRGTKSRGIVARKNPLERAAESRPKPSRPPPKRSRPASSSSRQSRVSYAEDDEEDVDEAPTPKKARKAGKPAKNKKQTKSAKSPAKPKGRKPISRAQIAEEEDDEEPLEEEAPPPKSAKKEISKSSRGRSHSKANYTDAMEDSDDEQPKSRGKKSASRRGSKTVSYSEKDDEDDDDEAPAEYTPRKSKSRGGPDEPVSSPKKKGKKKR